MSGCKSPGAVSVLGIPVALGAALLLFANSSGAQSLKMQASTELPPGGPTPQIIGGNPASSSDWPATFIFINSAGVGCTATVIGSRVLLTAAHCITNQATGSISLGDLKANVVCDQNPRYPNDISSDFALCRIDKALPKLGNGFEKVNTTDSKIPSKGQKVTLLGYGCITVGGGDRNFGTLYYGEATVTQTPQQDLYLVTHGDPSGQGGSAAVCFGDSGGGAYYAVNPTGTIRRLFGVNSRGDIDTNSWIATTANSVFIDWARTWASNNNIRICGLHPDAQDCRQ
jgi:trypsin